MLVLHSNCVYTNWRVETKNNAYQSKVSYLFYGFKVSECVCICAHVFTHYWWNYACLLCMKYVEHDMVLKFELTIIALKSSVFWDIMLCNPLKVNRWCGGMCHLSLQGLRISCLLSASWWFLACLILQSWRWMWHVPLKHWLTFNRLHSAIFREVELFITTSVKTSNHTSLLWFSNNSPLLVGL
jgi:hypothetical protein